MKRVEFSSYGAVFIILVVLTYFVSDQIRDERIDKYLQSQKDQLKQEIKVNFENSKKLSYIFFNKTIVYDKSVIELLKKAKNIKKRAMVRKELFSKLKEDFYNLKALGIKKMEFHLPNNETLLRMHNDKKFGDILVNYRDEIVQANEKKASFSGFSIDRIESGYSYINPIFDEKGEYLGNFELSFSPDYFSSQIEKSSNFKLQYLLKKTILDKKLFKDEIVHYNTFVLNRNYLVYNDFQSRYKNSNDDISGVLKDLKIREIYQTMHFKREYVSYFEYKNSYKLLVLLPILNDKDELLSYIIAYGIDADTEISMIHNYTLLLNLLLDLFYLIFIITFYFYSKKIKTFKIINRQYQDLSDSVDKYVLMTRTDKSGIIQYVSKAFCDASGYTKEELIGKPQNIIRHPDMSSLFFKDLWDTILSGEVWEGEIKNIDKRGNAYWVRGAIFPEFDEYDNIIGFSSIRVNISDEKELVKLNKRLKNKIEDRVNRLNMKDGSFIHNNKEIPFDLDVFNSLIYQWKKPISLISLYSNDIEYALKENIPDKEHVLKMNKKLTEEIESLSSTIKEFELLITKKSRIDRNFYSMVLELVHLIQKGNSGYAIFINIDGDKSLNLDNKVSETKLIVSNLLKSLVISFHDKFLREVRFDISYEKFENSLSLSISIDPKIFDDDNAKEIFSLSKSTNILENNEMSISKMMIKKLGGSLDIGNTDDKNIIFITLPIFNKPFELKDNE